MRIGIVGKKVGMTRIFDEAGASVTVTVVEAADVRVAQVKKESEKDGYNALQLAYGEKKPQNVSKSLAGHFKKAGFAAKAQLQEIRVANEEAIASVKPGTQLSVKLFKKGDKVDVTGITKGRGFSGVMKRHGFHGTKASHGVHEFFRHGGSIGSTTFPGRVLKNKKMPGQYGNTRCTTQNLEIVGIDNKHNLLLIKGSVPGARNSWVMIQSAVKKPLRDDAAWG